MRLIILPQALKIVIPGIVNSFISLFKDTSLVLIIGIFDLLGIVQLNFTDANWASPNTPATGYVFAARGLLDLLLRHVALFDLHRAPARHRPPALKEGSVDAWPNQPLTSGMRGRRDPSRAGDRHRRSRWSTMNKWYGDFHVLKNINLKVMRGERIVDLRAVGLGQVDDDPLHQPAGGAPDGHASSSTASSSPTT